MLPPSAADVYESYLAPAGSTYYQWRRSQGSAESKACCYPSTLWRGGRPGAQAVSSIMQIMLCVRVQLKQDEANAGSFMLYALDRPLVKSSSLRI